MSGILAERNIGNLKNCLNAVGKTDTDMFITAITTKLLCVHSSYKRAMRYSSRLEHVKNFVCTTNNSVKNIVCMVCGLQLLIQKQYFCILSCYQIARECLGDSCDTRYLKCERNASLSLVAGREFPTTDNRVNFKRPRVLTLYSHSAT